jgi:D-psicose/D-tagatose/L-ribulose 3-epimerase
MRFGINTWALMFPVDAGNLGTFLDQAASLNLPGGRPVIEVFASPDAGDLGAARILRDRASERGFGVVACGFNPHLLGPDRPSPHLVSPDEAERRAAIARACGFVDYAAAVAAAGDAGVLSGPWHTRHMHFTGAGLTPRERDWLVDGLKQIAARAEAKGVRAGFEVLNRFETYVLNTVADAMGVIREVGSDRVGINWDSSHACMDEPAGPVGSLREAAKSGHLFHVHVCENHRGEYGTGAIGPLTGDLLGILREHGYAGAVVPELFCEAIDPAVHKWVRRDGESLAAARRSIRFLSQFA